MGIISPTAYDALLLEKCKTLLGGALQKINRNGIVTNFEQFVMDLDMEDRGSRKAFEYLVSETTTRKPRKIKPILPIVNATSSTSGGNTHYISIIDQLTLRKITNSGGLSIVSDYQAHINAANRLDHTHITTRRKSIYQAITLAIIASFPSAFVPNYSSLTNYISSLPFTLPDTMYGSTGEIKSTVTVIELIEGCEKKLSTSEISTSSTTFSRILIRQLTDEDLNLFVDPATILRGLPRTTLRRRRQRRSNSGAFSESDSGSEDSYQSEEEEEEEDETVLTPQAALRAFSIRLTPTNSTSTPSNTTTTTTRQNNTQSELNELLNELPTSRTTLSTTNSNNPGSTFSENFTLSFLNPNPNRSNSSINPPEEEEEVMIESTEQVPTETIIEGIPESPSSQLRSLFRTEGSVDFRVYTRLRREAERLNSNSNSNSGTNQTTRENQDEQGMRMNVDGENSIREGTELINCPPTTSSNIILTSAAVAEAAVNRRRRHEE